MTRLVEIETVGDKEYILPQATPEALKRLEWLQPHFADQCGRIKMSVHSFLVETPTRRIVIDTGIGNDKRNRRVPAWNGRSGRFEQLTTAGFYARTRSDAVICTHLHVDHVGWNTRLVEGCRRPDFSKRALSSGPKRIRSFVENGGSMAVRNFRGTRSHRSSERAWSISSRPAKRYARS